MTGENPFGRPLKFGDLEQIKAIEAMNGDGLYCSRCYHAVEAHLWRPGERCCECRRGQYVMGAALERVVAAAEEEGCC